MGLVVYQARMVCVPLLDDGPPVEEMQHVLYSPQTNTCLYERIHRSLSVLMENTL